MKNTNYTLRDLAGYEAALLTVAHRESVSADCLRTLKNCPSRHHSLCRRMAMYLAHVNYGIGFRRLARICGVSHTTIIRGVRIIEDKRDEGSEYDALITSLEMELAG